MGFMNVIVRAWVPSPSGNYPDNSLPGQPPGIWGGGNEPFPTPPIAPGGRPPGFWGGTPPPYPDQGLPGQPPGIWGGAPPYVDIGLPGQPPGIWGGGNMPYPDQGLPGNQPGLWPGRPPYVDIGFPGDQPYPDQGLPPAGSGGPPPVFNPDDMPEHPEVPDLNHGRWLWIGTNPGVYKLAFVTDPTPTPDHPMYDAKSPPDQNLPGEWMIVLFNKRAAWAWVPSEAPSVEHH